MTEPKKDSEMSWFERLKFYTRDFTKEENLQLVRYIRWVKVEGLIQEGNDIEDLIKKEPDSL